MKTLILLVFIVFGTSISFAQPNNVVTAYMHLQEKQLEDAKEKIDAAANHDKTKSQAKTWYYRGKIYMAIYNDINASEKDYGISSEQLLLEAYRSFRKARGLNTERIGKKQLDREYQITANYLLNEGVSLYNNKKYKEAAELFKGTVEVQQDFQIVDSLALYNIALATEKAGNLDEAVEYYLKCARIGYQTQNAYHSAVLILRQQGNTDEAFEIVEEGLSKNPNDVNLLISKINMLLAMEDFKGALFTTDQALVEDPNNPNLHFTRGTLLERTDISEAISAYERTIEIDPKHINALYNLGAAYYNQAVELRNADNATNQTGVEELKKSRMYLERVEALSPGIESVQSSLETIKEILQD